MFLLALPPARAATEEEINNYLNQTIIPDFQIRNASAGDALALLQRQISLNRYGIFFVIAAKDQVSRTIVTIHLNNVSAMAVIATICSEARVQYAIKKGQIRIFQPWAPSPFQASPSTGVQPAEIGLTLATGRLSLPSFHEISQPYPAFVFFSSYSA